MTQHELNLVLSLLDSLLEEGKTEKVRDVIKNHLKATDPKAAKGKGEEDVK
jgi:predicted SnoaL-like aldol condensation-catalyzing enzyme